MANFNLALPFWLARREYPDRVAVVAEQRLTYCQAAGRAAALADWLGPQTRQVVILGSRSSAAYLAALGCCWSGATYIPFGLKWPEERICQLLSQIKPQALLVDSQGEGLLTPAVRAVAPRRILHPEKLDAVSQHPPAQVAGEDIAYVLFTSGTTGTPKGVMVSAAAVQHLIARAQELFPLTCHDRVAANFELSFDGSVFDMLLAWQAGATLYPIPSAQAMAPHEFLRRQEISLCVLAPSVLPFLRSLKRLQPGSLPRLRWSLFGAEALARQDALEWQAVAPNSQVYSLYGPTENTVTSLAQALTEPATITPERDTIALGRPLAGLQAVVLDANLEEVLPGQTGQLALSGAQLASGYFQDPALTASRFPTLRNKRYYLTGDLGYQDASGIFHHLGRSDHQVKIRGHRLELEEVETALRKVTQQAEVAATAWPNRPGQLNGLHCFVADRQQQPAEIFGKIKNLLPAYAWPAQIHCLPSLPHSENGKIDRAALLRWLDENV